MCHVTVWQPHSQCACIVIAVSIAVCPFLPNSICTSSDRCFCLDFCQLGMLNNIFHLLTLRACLLAPFCHRLLFLIFVVPYSSPCRLVSLSLFWAYTITESTFFLNMPTFGKKCLEPALKTKVGLILDSIFNMCMKHLFFALNTGLSYTLSLHF